MKESYYFPHDNNSHRDPKCSALINDFGMEGYGLYWAIIEILHEQDGKLDKFPKLWDGISSQLHIKKEALLQLIEALVKDYNLLKEDQNSIWSDRVLRNLDERREKYTKKSQAGRIGGLRSGASRGSKQNEALLQQVEQKERKGKERKLNTTTSYDFEYLWRQYPRREGRKAAERFFRCSVKTDKDFDDIKIALENYRESVKNSEMRFIKQGSTWFNNWRDYIDFAISGPVVQSKLPPKFGEE